MANRRGRRISFRAAIFIAFFLCGLIPVLAAGRVLVNSYEEKLIESRNIELMSEAQVLANTLGSGMLLEDGKGGLPNDEIDRAAGIYNCRILVIDRSFRVIRDTLGLDEGKIVVSESAISCFNGIAFHEISEEGLLRIAIPVNGSETGSVIGCVFIRADLGSLQAITASMRTRYWLIGVISGVAVGLAAFVLSTVFSSPLRRLIRQIGAKDKKETGTAFSMKGYSETDRIASMLNEIDKNARTEEDDRRQFVSNVSHELKTPIAAIRVLTDSLLEQEDVPNEVYRDFIQDISYEVERESAIIEDLLSMVRLENSSSMLNAERTDMNEFLETLLKRLNPLAAKAGVELVFESFRQVSAEIDQVKLSQALSNIIENGIKYNSPGGFVRVTLNADHRFAYITIADNGIGIPEEAQKHIFERFFRAEQSRSREFGGTGLGLSISQGIVFLHNGDIKFESEEGEGTTFTIRIPLIYIP
ncbi:MAG: cell wall metabolism sensor histidine kinase WalK [Lachnospiraceae bacterium]|nr:cell wall metabolism sensor histidine kinase WalK [Lachnospiraceae bacterium]